MDESICHHTNIASLSAMFVPSTKYRMLRNKFYEDLKWVIHTESDHVNTEPPELHGSKLLPDADDDNLRLKTVSRIVDLIVENEIELFRVGYRLTKKFRETFEHEHTWIGICWFGIQSVTQKLFERDILVPVMDSCSINHVHGISSQVKTSDILRSVGLENAISINNTNNLAEVLYAHSNYSSLTQVVDILSYLRHISDWNQSGLKMSDFKKSLLSISTRLTSQFKCEEIVEMKFRT